VFLYSDNESLNRYRKKQGFDQKKQTIGVGTRVMNCV